MARPGCHRWEGVHGVGALRVGGPRAARHPPWRGAVGHREGRTVEGHGRAVGGRLGAVVPGSQGTGGEEAAQGGHLRRVRSGRQPLHRPAFGVDPAGEAEYRRCRRLAAEASATRRPERPDDRETVTVVAGERSGRPSRVAGDAPSRDESNTAVGRQERCCPCWWPQRCPVQGRPSDS